MMSIDSAVSAIIMATRPMNSAVDIGMFDSAAAARSGSRMGAFMMPLSSCWAEGRAERVAPVGAASGQIVASCAGRLPYADVCHAHAGFPRQLTSSLR